MSSKTDAGIALLESIILFLNDQADFMTTSAEKIVVVDKTMSSETKLLLSTVFTKIAERNRDFATNLQTMINTFYNKVN